MFENEIAVNEFQLDQFARIVADLDEGTLFQPGLGHGHPPIWILGHLAITGEMGQALLGGKVMHRSWLPLFGPGSSNDVPRREELTLASLSQLIPQTYRELRRLAASADPVAMQKPHGFKLFENSPIQTVGHAITLLLTNHFGFHLSQLSSCRRAAGHKALF